MSLGQLRTPLKIPENPTKVEIDRGSELWKLRHRKYSKLYPVSSTLPTIIPNTAYT